MKKRVLSLVLALTLALSLMPAAAPHVHAEETCTEHTYELGKYATDSSHHYAMCDVCGYWSGLNWGPHEDNNADCICDVCQYVLHWIFEPVNLGDGTHQGVCDLCGQTVTVAHAFEEIVWNEEKHWPVCGCGVVDPEGESAAHTFDYDCYHTDDDKHYPECDDCYYYQPEGEAHSFDEGSDQCTVCYLVVHNYVWDGKTWDSEGHLLQCGNCESGYWEDHTDGEDEDALCDVCGFNLGCSHENNEKRYDAEIHYIVCNDCEQVVITPEAHSFEDERYSKDADKHYRMCYNCEYYLPEGEAHSFAQGSEDCLVCHHTVHAFAWDQEAWDFTMHRIACSTCDAIGWENHADGADADSLCDSCGFNMACTHENGETRYDGESHYYACTACGQITNSDSKGPHSFDQKRYHTDADKHYRKCNSCDYHLPEGEGHSFAEGSEVCSVCNLTVHQYAWDEKTWDGTYHTIQCSNCENGYMENHADGADADALCDVCGFNLACPHQYVERRYDEVNHFDACTVCGQITYGASKSEHSFGSEYYYETADMHYPECDACKYYLADQGAAHINTDGDGNCDVCGFDMHEHTFEYHYWYGKDQYHYPRCDRCSYYDSEQGEACADNGSDHYCDTCYSYTKWLCADNDNDHICDVCVREMTDLCRDDNNDHDCDVQACQRYMWELCSAAVAGDWICDTCGRNFCSHSFANSRVSNGDGTHTRECYYCGTVTEACTAWNYNYNDTVHTAICQCGYYFPAEEHDWLWYARALNGHRLGCADCNASTTDPEPHIDQDGICAVCELQLTDYDDVYVGGIGLKSGQYLDNSGNVTDSKPEGGYAYYKDGVLELNGYVYEGHGCRWMEYEYGEVQSTAIYATTDLILVLKGESSLKTIRPETILYSYGDGIAILGNLTIRGDGSLSIQCEDDGMDAEPGNVCIEGGTLTIQSGDHGLDIDGSITVTGGRVNMTAGDDGFNADGDITISGGDITIDTEDNALDSANGSVNISGGNVDLTTRDYDGIDADKAVDISGGTITMDAGGFGIHSYGDVDISGGDLEIRGTEIAIYAEYEDVIISGGNLSLTSTNSNVIQAPGGQLQLPAGADPTGKNLTIVTPFSAALEADGIHLTGSPWDLTVLIAAYDESGMLIDLQLVENPGDVVTPTVTGGTVKAFFLNGKAAPVHISLTVK